MTRRPTLKQALLALKLVSLACSTYVAVAQLRAALSETAEDASPHDAALTLTVDDGDTVTFVPDGRYKVANAVVDCATCDTVDRTDREDVVLALHGDAIPLAEFNGYIAEHEMKFHADE